MIWKSSGMHRLPEAFGCKSDASFPYPNGYMRKEKRGVLVAYDTHRNGNSREPYRNPSSGRSPGGQARQPSGRRYSPPNRSRPPEEVDRYHYVDRDIYSSSKRGAGGTPPGGKPPKKKKSRLKVAILVTLSILLVLVLAAVGFVYLMFSRLNRPEIDIHQYSTASDPEVASMPDVMNILLIGVDKNDDGTNGRSDSMMLVSLNSKQKTMKMVSFLRDTYVDIPTVGMEKLNVAYMTGGASLTMQTLRNNFLVSVDRYVEIDFENFASIIDAMGGIEVEINQAEADYLNEVRGENLSAGTNHMRGALALYYSRMRYLDSDFARTSRQRQVIGCMMDKIQQMGPVEAVSFIWNCMPYITTNLSNGELTALATQALDITNYETGTLYIPYKDMYENDRNEAGDVLVPDLEANQDKLQEFLYPEETASPQS